MNSVIGLMIQSRNFKRENKKLQFLRFLKILNSRNIFLVSLCDVLYSLMLKWDRRKRTVCHGQGTFSTFQKF